MLAEVDPKDSQRSSRETLGRTPISDAVRLSISDAFRAVPEGRRSALLVIADERGARAMVAAGTAVEWTGKRPTGYVSIEGSW